MTSKEALELLELILLNHSSMLVINDKRFEYFNVIKERLETLEKENEKLKKAFQILTQRIVIKAHRNFLFGGRHLDVANTTMKLTDEEYDLLKEVLGE